jgi:hypothetical protein
MGCSSLSSIDLSPFDEAKITDVNNLFNGCSSLSSIDLSPLVYGSIRNNNTSLFRSCVNLKTIIAPWSTAPTMSSSAFGSSNANYVGRNTYNKGENKLYVPAGATGYDTGYWLDPLQNSSKCGFTLSATL